MLLSEAAALVDSDTCEPTPAALQLRARADGAAISGSQIQRGSGQGQPSAGESGCAQACAILCPISLSLYISRCARARVRACMRACMRACVIACVPAYLSVHVSISLSLSLSLSVCDYLSVSLPVPFTSS